ncbi:hypothetical protein [Nocardioides bruguierae]|uniref:Uncharacterized protein n=1 Tax=Nocardioides bruguierae TaxID=2945102 RepID=A0A9X2IFB1_9ACTN|nr:hypothetical protein [Nocardioides bruguierae]MCM0620229.1 hypothetical protein [Nocardioides bruguierae]
MTAATPRARARRPWPARVLALVAAAGLLGPGLAACGLVGGTPQALEGRVRQAPGVVEVAVPDPDDGEQARIDVQLADDLDTASVVAVVQRTVDAVDSADYTPFRLRLLDSEHCTPESCGWIEIDGDRLLGPGAGADVATEVADAVDVWRSWSDALDGSVVLSLASTDTLTARSDSLTQALAALAQDAVTLPGTLAGHVRLDLADPRRRLVVTGAPDDRDRDLVRRLSAGLPRGGDTLPVAWSLQVGATGSGGADVDHVLLRVATASASPEGVSRWTPSSRPLRRWLGSALRTLSDAGQRTGAGTVQVSLEDAQEASTTALTDHPLAVRRLGWWVAGQEPITRRAASLPGAEAWDRWLAQRAAEVAGTG